jgi:hypothetical protein
MKSKDHMWAARRAELLSQIQQLREFKFEAAAALGAVPLTHDAPAPVWAGVLDATDLLRHEHSATLALFQAQLHLGCQQLAMQADPIGASN